MNKEKLIAAMFKAIQDSRDVIVQDRYGNHEYGDIDQAEAAEFCAEAALKELDNEWVRVEDRLPDVGERVIGFSDWGICSHIMHLNINGRWVYTGINKRVFKSNEPTRWQPLPSPPKDK